MLDQVIQVNQDQAQIESKDKRFLENSQLPSFYCKYSSLVVALAGLHDGLQHCVPKLIALTAASRQPVVESAARPHHHTARPVNVDKLPGLARPLSVSLHQ